MKMILYYAKNLGFEIVELSIVKENVTAYPLVKKNGFKECGMFNKALRYQDGIYADLVYITKEL